MELSSGRTCKSVVHITRFLNLRRVLVVTTGLEDTKSNILPHDLKPKVLPHTSLVQRAGAGE